MTASAIAAAQRGLAADARTLESLHGLAGRDAKAALKEAARQFEALFMREVLKSMRAATLRSGLIDNDASELGMELLDEQWALALSGLPGGLAEMIERQLQRHMAASDGATAARAGGGAIATPPVARDTRVPAPTAAQLAFIERHRATAQQVARESGIPAAYMLGQAALESGWGQREIRLPDGSPSYNLFGIKAGPGWTGRVAEVTTTEYIGGQPRKVVQRFRAYASYAEAFRDYARLLTSSPRYQAVLRSLHSAQAFAQQLQEAGYATDPDYAAKLSRVINATLRWQRALA